ncbi:LppU/SCO3897 family protein [Salinispora tropica]|uniref:Septum formation-related domain-containing protein n=1 Tax=Salinispora tropica (strain ATCC BAA-916 / DSM 44818 / JCM 13857 / NBRC 105044 / CNB-440) TaxID=369723 RepID=A4X3C4_SALTO|nr:hypothetical protein [Salinispora tropica]ABP53374.1 hypothetical protein Strop_0897 [Salinispora tropica CNB-440]
MPEQVVPPAHPDLPQPAGAQPPADATPAGAPAPAPEPVRKSGRKKVLGIVGAIVAFLVIAGLKFGIGTVLSGTDETAEAKAGDCIAELPTTIGDELEEVDGGKVVDCASAEATYKVVGRADDQTEEQAASGEACDQFFQENEEYYVFSNVMPGKTGYLLCLTTNS